MSHVKPLTSWQPQYNSSSSTSGGSVCACVRIMSAGILNNVHGIIPTKLNFESILALCGSSTKQQHQPRHNASEPSNAHIHIMRAPVSPFSRCHTRGISSQNPIPKGNLLLIIRTTGTQQQYVFAPRQCPGVQLKLIPRFNAYAMVLMLTSGSDAGCLFSQWRPLCCTLCVLAGGPLLSGLLSHQTIIRRFQPLGCFQGVCIFSRHRHYGDGG